MLKNKNDISFYLNEKENQVMNVLWKSEKPLSASEIANQIDSKWASKSIHNIIRKLESKKAIEVAEITKIGKTYGRLFRPTVSADEYATIQFDKFYKKSKTLPSILCSLVEIDNTNNSELTNALEDLLNKFKTDN